MRQPNNGINNKDIKSLNKNQNVEHPIYVSRIKWISFIENKKGKDIGFLQDQSI